MSERIKLRCDRCGKEHYTRYYDIGDMHGLPCGGEFKPVDPKTNEYYE